ncbi:MAG: hypothetical protein LLF76_03405 [Planctomycetaceae bacterium]|nr:hypothetical protein [Planctomycetaceae bacterium]
MIDRYTILKFTERWGNFRDSLAGAIAGLYSLCTGSPRARLFSLGLIILLGAAAWWVIPMCKGKPSVSAAAKLVLQATDAGGNTWAIDFLRNQDPEAILNDPNKPGQPLTLTFKFTRKQAELQILPELAGTAGERYLCGIVKNGLWQQPPMLILSNQQDEPLGSGRLKYG